MSGEMSVGKVGGGNPFSKVAAASQNNESGQTEKTAKKLEDSIVNKGGNDKPYGMLC